MKPNCNYLMKLTITSFNLKIKIQDDERIEECLTCDLIEL